MFSFLNHQVNGKIYEVFYHSRSKYFEISIFLKFLSRWELQFSEK